MRTAVVMPVGPRDDWRDTLASIHRYLEAPSIYLIDDGVGIRSSEATVIRAERNVTGPRGGGLWVNLARGYQAALADGFEILLRIDADALLIGPGLDDRARERFAADSRLGMLGSYRIGLRGGPRNFEPARVAISRETGIPGLCNPRRRRFLRKLLDRAAQNGYVLGEHPLGGAYIHSRTAVETLHALGWLDARVFRRSGISEDQLMGLMTIAAGFTIGDFGGPDDPMALKWIGLPCSPDELLARGKLVTHSVRSYEGMDEAAIRSRFAAVRAAAVS